MSYSVVVAEDEMLLLENLINKINNAHFDFKVVGSAQTGIQAYDLIKHHNPDLLITDIQMPAMDGLQLIKKVSENHPSIDCVIISGFSDFSYAKTAIHYHVNEYLLKPIEEVALNNVLSNLKNKYLVREASYKDIFKSEQNILQPSEIAELMKQYMNDHFNEDIKLNNIAASMNYSSSYLTKIFSQYYDCSPTKYLISLRIQKAQQLLKHNPDITIRQIGEAVGYPEQGYFSRIFKKHTGINPLEYREDQHS